MKSFVLIVIPARLNMILIAHPKTGVNNARELVAPHASRGRVSWAKDRRATAPCRPGMEAEGGWYGILAPAGTSREVVQRLNTGVVRILKMPAIIERLNAMGSENATSTPAELATAPRDDPEALRRDRQGGQDRAAITAHRAGEGWSPFPCRITSDTQMFS